MIGSIIGYLGWPFMIMVSYILIRWALKRFEKLQSEEQAGE